MIQPLASNSVKNSAHLISMHNLGWIGFFKVVHLFGLCPLLEFRIVT